MKKSLIIFVFIAIIVHLLVDIPSVLDRLFKEEVITVEEEPISVKGICFYMIEIEGEICRDKAVKLGGVEGMRDVTKCTTTALRDGKSCDMLEGGRPITIWTKNRMRAERGLPPLEDNPE